MSEIELPEPQLLGAEVVGHVAEFYGYTVEQVRQLLAAERERCALIADRKAADIARVNTYRGKVNQVSQHVVEMVESVAAAIRKG